jgi:2,4-dienoyl-CoA reductase (NADPH2)
MQDGGKGYSNIFGQGRLGGLTTKNRVKYAACSVSNFNTSDGFITDREFARLEVIARTGAGIITNQGAFPDRRGEGKAYIRQLSINDDRYIPGLKKTADIIHKNDAIAIQQILHGGRYGGIGLDYCLQPSQVPQTLRHFRQPKVMTKDDIGLCIKEHGEASRRAIDAGFDGIEVTGFMGYLVSNFNSKFTNTRSDEYGGSVENRGRFMAELIGGIKDVIGKDRPLVIRLCGEELMDEYNGNSPEECLEFMRIAERAGVDSISLVVGWHESRTGALGRDLPSDNWLYLAENAKKHVKVPVAFGPKFGSADLAEDALAKGKMDFWEICRPFLADPEMLKKISENRGDEVKPCLGGLLCLSRMFRNLPYICTVNPRLGHEVEPEYQLTTATVKKKVMVIGAGPAGLECAVTAAKRGHTVSVYDKNDALGGQLLMASKEILGGGIFLDLIRYYKKQLEINGIESNLGVEVNSDLVKKVRPDVAVVATGANTERQNISGIERANVTFIRDVLDGKADVGDNIVVVGGERAGLVVAEHLATKGHKVWIVEKGAKVASDVMPTFKWRHLSWLKEFRIEALTNSHIKEINEEGAIIQDGDGTERKIAADTIVISGPRRSRQELVDRLEFLSDELYVIGDALKPRSVHNAIHEGFKIGVRI